MINDDWYTQYFISQQITSGANAGLYAAPDTLLPLFDGDGNILAPEILADAGLLSSEEGFLDANGDSFNNFTLTTTWSQSTLNRGRLATRGSSQSVSLELSVPGSDLEYMKVVYNGQLFIPISQSFTLRLRTELGYGDGLGGGNALPFFNNFYSGGFGSVRGFKSNTLGPRSTPAFVYSTGVAVTDIVEAGDVGCEAAVNTGDVCSNGAIVGQAVGSDDKPSYRVVLDSNGQPFIPFSSFDNDPDPFGGNVLIEAGAELLFPLPFIKDQRSVRTAFFIDVGNVFSTHCGNSQLNCFSPNMDELRYSFGVGLSWITGFGPLTFSFAKPLNEGPEDETEAFQFSLGRSF